MVCGPTLLTHRRLFELCLWDRRLSRILSPRGGSSEPDANMKLPKLTCIWSSLLARSQLLLRLLPAVCYTVSVIWIPMVMIYRMVRFPIWPVVSDTEEDGWEYGHLILSIRCDPRIESLESNLSFMIPMEQSWILVSLRDIRRLMWTEMELLCEIVGLFYL